MPPQIVAATFSSSISSGGDGFDVARLRMTMSAIAPGFSTPLRSSLNSAKAPSMVKPAIESVRLCRSSGAPSKAGVARHRRLDAEQRIERGDRPVAGEDEPRAGVADRLPRIAGPHAVAADHREDRLDRIGAARRMRRLHRRQHAKFSEARQVGRRQHFDMLDPVAAVARAIGAARAAS